MSGIGRLVVGLVLCFVGVEWLPVAAIASGDTPRDTRLRCRCSSGASYARRAQPTWASPSSRRAYAAMIAWFGQHLA